MCVSVFVGFLLLSGRHYYPVTIHSTQQVEIIEEIYTHILSQVKDLNRLVFIMSALASSYKQGSTVPCFSGIDEPDLLSEESLEVSSPSDCQPSISLTSITSLESYQPVTVCRGMSTEHKLRKNRKSDHQFSSMDHSSTTEGNSSSGLSETKKRSLLMPSSDDSMGSSSAFNTAFYTPRCKSARPSRIRTCASMPRPVKHSSHGNSAAIGLSARRARCLTNGSLLKSGDESSLLCTTRGSVEDSIQYGMSLLSMSSNSLDSEGNSVNGASGSSNSSRTSTDLDFNIYKIQTTPLSHGKRKLHNTTYNVDSMAENRLQYSGSKDTGCVAAKRLRLEDVHGNSGNRTEKFSRDAFTKEYVKSCRRYSCGGPSVSRRGSPSSDVDNTRQLVGYGEQFCVQTLSAGSDICDYFKSVSNPSKAYTEVNVDEVMSNSTPNPYSFYSKSSRIKESEADSKSLKRRLKKIKKFLQGRGSSKSTLLSGFKTLAVM